MCFDNKDYNYNGNVILHEMGSLKARYLLLLSYTK